MVKPGSDPIRTLNRKQSESLLRIIWPAIHPPILLPGTDQEVSPTVNLKILKNKKCKTSQVELYLRQDHSSEHSLNQHNQQNFDGHERLKLGDFLLSDMSMNIQINSQYIYGCQVTYDKFVSSKVTSTTTTTSRYILKDLYEECYRTHIRGIKEAAETGGEANHETLTEVLEEINYGNRSRKPEEEVNDEKRRGSITCKGDCSSEQKNGNHCTESGNRVYVKANEVVSKRPNCQIPRPILKTAAKRKRTGSSSTCQSKNKDGNENYSCQCQLKMCTCSKSSDTSTFRNSLKKWDKIFGSSEEVAKSFCSSRVRPQIDVGRKAIPILKKQYERQHQEIPKCENDRPKSSTFKNEPDHNRSRLKDSCINSNDKVNPCSCKIHQNERNSCSSATEMKTKSANCGRLGRFFECLDSDLLSTEKSTNSDDCTKQRSKSSEKEPLCYNNIPLKTIVETSNESKRILLPPPPKGILKRTSSSMDKYMSAKSSQSDLSEDKDDSDYSQSKPSVTQIKLKLLKPEEKCETSRGKSSQKVHSHKSAKENKTSFKNEGAVCDLPDNTSKENEVYKSKHFIEHLLDLIRSFKCEKEEPKDSDKRRKSPPDVGTHIFEGEENASSKIKDDKYVENDVCTKNLKSHTSRYDAKRKNKTSCDEKRTRDVNSSSSQSCKCEHNDCEIGKYDKARSQQNQTTCINSRSRKEQISQNCKQDASRSKERKYSCQKDKTRDGNSKSEDNKRKSFVKTKKNTAKYNESTTSSESSDYISTFSRSNLCSSCGSSSQSQTTESYVCDTCKCEPTSQSNTSTCSCHLHMSVCNTLTPQSSVSSRRSETLRSSSDGNTSSETPSQNKDDEQCKVKQDKNNPIEAQRNKTDNVCKKINEMHVKDSYEILKNHAKNRCNNKVISAKRKLRFVERKNSDNEYGSSHSITISASDSEIYSFLGCNEEVKTLYSGCIVDSVDDIQDGKYCQKQNKDEEKENNDLCAKRIGETSTESELDSCTKCNKDKGKLISETPESKTGDLCKKSSSEKEVECNNKDLEVSKTLDLTCEKKKNESCKKDNKDDSRDSKGKEKCPDIVCRVQKTNKISKIKEKFEHRKDKCEFEKRYEDKREISKPDNQELCNNELEDNDVELCLINEEYPKICVTIKNYENNTDNECPKITIREKLEPESVDKHKEPCTTKKTQNVWNTKPTVINIRTKENPEEKCKDNKVSNAKLKFEENIQKSANKNKCQSFTSPCKKSQERPGSCNSRGKSTGEFKHTQFLHEIKNVHNKIMANKCTDETNCKCADRYVPPKKTLDACIGEICDRDKTCIINGDVKTERTETCNAFTQSEGDNCKGNQNNLSTKNVQTEKCVGFILDQIEASNPDDDDVVLQQTCSNKLDNSEKHVKFRDDVLSEKKSCEKVLNQQEYVYHEEMKTEPRENADREDKRHIFILPGSHRRLSERRSVKWDQGILDNCNLDRQQSRQKCLRLFDINLDNKESRTVDRNTPSVRMEKRNSKSRSRPQGKRSKDDMKGNDVSSRASMRQFEDKGARNKDHKKSDGSHHTVGATQLVRYETKSCHHLEVKDSLKQPFATGLSRVSRANICYITTGHETLTSEQKFNQNKIEFEQKLCQNSDQNQQNNTYADYAEQRARNENVNLKKYPGIVKERSQAVPLDQGLAKPDNSGGIRLPLKSIKRHIISGAKKATNRAFGSRTQTYQTHPVPHVTSKTNEAKENHSDSNDRDTKLINDAFDKVYTELESYFKNKQNLSDTLAHLSQIEKLTNKILNKEEFTNLPLDMNFSASYTEYLLEKNSDEIVEFEQKFERFLARKQLKCYHTFNQDLTQDCSSVGTAASRMQSAHTTRVWSRQGIRCNHFSINFEDMSRPFAKRNLPKITRNRSYLHNEWKQDHECNMKIKEIR